MLRRRAASVALTRGSVALTCSSVTSTRSSVAPSARMRAYVAASVILRRVLASTLDKRPQRAYIHATKSEIVRSPTLAAVGGTGVLDKHISPVSVRELSLLLLPRTLGVCTHLGKHQPEVP